MKSAQRVTLFHPQQGEKKKNQPCDYNILCHYFPISIFSPFQSASGKLAAHTRSHRIFSRLEPAGTKVVIYLFWALSVQHKQIKDCFDWDCFPRSKRVMILVLLWHDAKLICVII